jgi:hypothetical protein
MPDFPNDQTTHIKKINRVKTARGFPWFLWKLGIKSAPSYYFGLRESLDYVNRLDAKAAAAAAAPDSVGVAKVKASSI